MTWAGYVAGAAALVLALETVASAHVRITPAVARHGAPAVIAFRVPNERPNARTVALEVQFPQDRRIASVRVRRIAGWTCRVHMRDGAVDTITWTGGAIRGHGVQTFAVVTSSLPASGAVLYFKTLQTYSDGVVVRWIEIRSPGAPEPENPAPMLRLTG